MSAAVPFVPFPQAVERSRMAIADIGLDPALIDEHAKFDETRLDIYTAWKAREVARAAAPWCWLCFSAYQDTGRVIGHPDQCRSSAPTVEDCGCQDRAVRRYRGML